LAASGIRSSLSAISVVALCSCASEPPQVPEVTWDGLVEVEREGLDKVYLRPGATLGPYRRVLLRAATVSFDQNWRPFEDRDEHGPRVDPNRIAEEIGKTFDELTVEELEAGGYQLAKYPDDDVLRVVPTITDLFLSVPDQAQPGGAVASGVSTIRMGLAADLRESVTNTALARVFDHVEASGEERLPAEGGSLDRERAKPIIRKWAVALRSALDRARAAEAAEPKSAVPSR
jgi:hypothetical protein